MQPCDADIPGSLPLEYRSPSAIACVRAYQVAGTCASPKAHHAGGRRGKERAASLRAQQRLAAGGAQRSPDPDKLTQPECTDPCG